MPHVNHKRGETPCFVFRREHGSRTYMTFYKGKRNSDKWAKTWINRKLRRGDRLALIADPEDPFDLGRKAWSLGWMLS